MRGCLIHKGEGGEKIIPPPCLRADIVSKTHEELGFPADICHWWEQNLQKVFATGIPVKEEFEIKSPDLIASKYVLLQRGKKTYFLLKVVYIIHRPNTIRIAAEKRGILSV